MYLLQLLNREDPVIDTPEAMRLGWPTAWRI